MEDKKVPSQNKSCHRHKQNKCWQLQGRQIQATHSDKLYISRPSGSIDAVLSPSLEPLFPFSVHTSFFATMLKPLINATTTTAIAHESPNDENESCSQKSARELENSPPISTAEESTRIINPAKETLTTTNSIRVLSDIKRVFQSSTTMLTSKRPAKTKRNSRKTMPATAITNETPSISYYPEHSRRLISFIFQ